MVKGKENMNSTEQAKPNLVAGINLDDIVKRAQAMFGKDKAGARMITTGASLQKPSKDSDFILWRKNNFWQELTGLRGLVAGRVHQISGKMDSGKSSLAGQFMVEAQEQENVVILWDAEQKFSASRYDTHLGGKSANLAIISTNSITEGARSLAFYISAIKEAAPKAKILIVIDSIGVLNNRTELGGDDGSEDMSKQPGVMSKEIGFLFRKINRLTNDYQDKETGDHTITTLVINQVYANIGSVGVVERGGSQLGYSSSLIIQLSRKQDLVKVKGGKKIKFGIVSRAKSKKNHLFDGSDCVAELDIVVSADGIGLANEVKKKDNEVQGWEDPETDSE
jgi:RecA/RadA recombinase